MDPYLIELAQRLAALAPREARAALEELEDRYDAYTGPAQELADQLLEALRQRLAAAR